MQCIKEQILISTNQFGPACYIIRNGKVWIDRTAKEQPVMSPKYEYWDFLYAALEKYVVDNLKKKACTIRYPKDLVLTCPVSEKNFFGNIPFGSFYHMPDEDGVFGVHWDNKSGINDIDLSFVSMDGCKIGWNSGYYTGNHSVILATGGMKTKLRAAAMCHNAGCDMIIANGADPDLLYRLIDGESVGTKFIAKKG